MKNMQMTKERVSKVTLPENPVTYDEWVKMYGFGNSYIQPTKFFQGHELNMKKFIREETGVKLSWQNILITPIEFILKTRLNAW